MGAEWVIAPTATKFTPVSRNLGCFLYCQAATRLESGSACQLRDDTGHRNGAHIVEQDLGSARRNDFTRLLSRGHFNLNRYVGKRLSDSTICGNYTPGRDHMVVLDQRGISQ